MKKASNYLNPSENSEVKTETTLKRHIDEDVETDHDRPETRADCPDVRPCPYVGCRYHLFLDVTESGSIKFNFHGLDPDDLRPSCALDVADEVSEMTLREAGGYFGLTRERIRQIQVKAIDKIQEETQ